ncbi:hypothetical protein EVAR_13417_1 [Eumeta japonica]|uniref:Uncharacterized protein n=1 Tax=Eumeta variegata TaxID=151549 RepID=A0A4C1V608_EUMVA|nr:hypothetical protein EVAR_13417_1 [Eumeta japonica]
MQYVVSHKIRRAGRGQSETLRRRIWKAIHRNGRARFTPDSIIRVRGALFFTGFSPAGVILITTIVFITHGDVPLSIRATHEPLEVGARGAGGAGARNVTS